MNDTNMILPFIKRAQKSAERISQFTMEHLYSDDKKEKDLLEMIFLKCKNLVLCFSGKDFNGHDCTIDHLNYYLEDIVNHLNNIVYVYAPLQNSESTHTETVIPQSQQEKIIKEQNARIEELEKKIAEQDTKILKFDNIKLNSISEEEFNEIFNCNETPCPKISIPQGEQEKIIEEQAVRIKELEEMVADYSAKYDPSDLRKKKFSAMTIKQHVIYFLAILAYNDRLPNNRKNMSYILSFISGRNETSTLDNLGRSITQEECNTLADIFCNNSENPNSYQCPFIANIIRELPNKLKQDISKKNKEKALK